MIKVVADKDIPFLEGVLEPYAEVKYMKGGDISPEAISGAQAIFIRTRTKCNETLLRNSEVEFIASATIGTDHVDLPYLKSKGIAFANAPGCNAGGVMQYVFTALYATCCRKGIPLKNKTIGVIGVGNTGGRVAALGEYLGFHVLRNDPPKAAFCGDASEYCTLDYLLQHSDIISMHVPLDETTKAMAGEGFFKKIRPDSVFINASRGEAVQDTALADCRSSLSAVILDVWNGEPASINEEMIRISDIATPHIAGYSYEGKINGTAMSVRAFAKYFGIAPLEHFEPAHTPTPVLAFHDKGKLLPQDEIAGRLLSAFPLYELDSALRANPSDFEKIRSAYKYRREFQI